MQGIVLKSQLPLRAESSHRSEMVSQLIFGEIYTILDRIDNWILIKSDFDSYIGWIDELSLDEYIGEYEFITVKNKYLKVINENNEEIILTGGSKISTPNSDGVFNICNKNFIIPQDYQLLTSSNIINTARLFITSPYLWGGRTFMGFDCSGFTQVVYMINNISLPRDASEQIKHGESISIIQEAHEGDLVFFGNEESITHVGILLSTDQVIHCSGEVRIDRIDNTGIFNGHKYTHFLRGIKSFQQF